MSGNNYYGNIDGKNIALTQPYASKGQSYTGNLKSAFGSSPIHSGELTAEERKETFQQLVLDGEPLNLNEDGSFSIPNTINGYFPNGISRDYIANGAPDISNIDITDDTALGETLPSPYMPNPTSPGVGSVNASDKPAYEGEVKDPNIVNSQFGSGNNSVYNPAVSSQKLSDLKLGSYLPGTSGGN
jgi:hypothetical protein